ncbi:MAG: TetR/AcrR family transcriptional regulator [Bacteroidota bacterium]|nr:TetR/AcrR family transcriptional regulator [Bacteroidota bacterium]
MRQKTGDKDKRIAAAAIQVFARDGFHGAKITRIAREAGVATGSVYLYFRNKESILHHLFDTLWRELHAAFNEITRREDLTARDKVEEIIDRLFDQFGRNPSLALLFVNEQPQLLRQEAGTFMQYYVDFLQLGERVVREGMRSGEFRSDVDARIFTNLVFGAARQLLHQWARAPRQFPLTTVRREIKTVFLEGLLLAR